MKRLLSNQFIPAIYLCVLLLQSGCGGDDEGGTCRFVEALAGYPESFENPDENIEYYIRIEFDYDGEGEILEVREYRIEDEQLLRSITDFTYGEGDLIPESSEDGRYFFPNGSDQFYEQFIEIFDGNAELEGVAPIDDREQASPTARNYFDAHPNVYKTYPELRQLAVGRPSLAGVNSENNIIGWVDLTQGNLFLSYKKEFDAKGRLVRTQVPSGLTIDFTYACQ